LHRYARVTRARMHVHTHTNRLFLVVKRKGQKLAGESDWAFPQV
jgi:hypothetical protein